MATDTSGHPAVSERELAARTTSEDRHGEHSPRRVLAIFAHPDDAEFT